MVNSDFSGSLDLQKVFLDWLYSSSYDYVIDDDFVVYMFSRSIPDRFVDRFLDFFTSCGIDYMSLCKMVRIPCHVLPDLFYSLKNNPL